jgi:hypothetical protein
VDFRALQLFLEGSSSVAGNFKLSNQPGGSIRIDHNLSFPGSVDLGGLLALAHPSTSVEVARTLTLEATGEIDNPGTLKVGEYVDLGGTLEGNPPVVVGLPGPHSVPVIDDIRIVNGSTQRKVGEAASQGLVVRWHGASAGGYQLSGSDDLVHWHAVGATVTAQAGGGWQATLPRPGNEWLFLRVEAR